MKHGWNTDYSRKSVFHPCFIRGQETVVKTLEQIDSDLHNWDQKLRIASDNMLELTDSVSYQRLLGEAHWPKAQLTGATADRAGPAIDGLHTLWIYYALLRDTIGRAKSCASRSLCCCRRGTCWARSKRCCMGPPSNCRRWPRRWNSGACWPPPKCPRRSRPSKCWRRCTSSSSKGATWC